MPKGGVFRELGGMVTFPNGRADLNRTHFGVVGDRDSLSFLPRRRFRIAMPNPSVRYATARPRRAKSLMPEIVLFSMCVITLLIGLAG